MGYIIFIGNYMTREEFIEISGLVDGVVILEPFDLFADAIIGVSSDSCHVVYNYEKLVEIISNKYDLNPNDASEYVDYNILGFCVSEYYPIVVYPTIMEEGNENSNK